MTDYNMDMTPWLRQSDGTLKTEEGGWLASCPLSLNPEGGIVTGLKGTKHVGGTFVIQLLVTERDSSNAKKYLERAAKMVADSKDKVLKLVTPEPAKQVGGVVR
jgi:hypothetical protein